MDIYRAEKVAQDRMANARNGEWDKGFVLAGPGGVIACEWLDPYFGMFTIKGKDGFMRTKDIPAGVEALMPEPEAIDG